MLSAVRPGKPHAQLVSELQALLADKGVPARHINGLHRVVLAGVYLGRLVQKLLEGSRVHVSIMSVLAWLRRHAICHEMAGITWTSAP